MAMRALLRLCVGVAVGLSFATSSLADPITVVLDTVQLSGQTLTLDFELTASTSNTVTISEFMSGGVLDDTTIIRTAGVAGTLGSTDVVLPGSLVIPVQYLESIEFGNSLSFTFDSTNSPVGDAQADLFALYLFDASGFPPVDDNGAPLFGDPGSGVLLTYEFGTDSPVLSLYSTDLLPVAQATVSNLVPEPGVPALVMAAAIAAVIGRRRSLALSRG
jgi:hypothetical protein